MGIETVLPRTALITKMLTCPQRPAYDAKSIDPVAGSETFAKYTDFLVTGAVRLERLGEEPKEEITAWYTMETRIMAAELRRLRAQRIELKRLQDAFGDDAVAAGRAGVR